MTVANDMPGPEIILPKWHIPPPVLAGIAFGMQGLLTRRRVTTTFSRTLGWLGCGGSILLVGAAVVQFQQNHTTINPKTLDATKLIVTGPNRWTRNPMYLGTTGLLVSYAVSRRSWSAVIPAAAYTIVIDRVQIPVEEVMLQQRFGAEFERYRAATPRWLGCLSTCR